MSHPTGPWDEGWFEWAEAETVARLRRQIAERRALVRPAPPEPAAEPEQQEIRLEEAPARVIRIHQENLSTA